ncbi:hypothetical protein [Streptomyces sp. NPDC002671]
MPHRERFFTQAMEQASTPPSCERDPVGHLVGTWWSTLRKGGLKNSSDVLEQQSADMVDAWGKGSGLTTKVQNSLHENALNDTFHARSDALRDLP